MDVLIPVLLLFYVFVFSVYAPSRRVRRNLWFKGHLAHRGLYTSDQSVPENSLEAFRLAKEAGYGSELDVQCTKDGQLVVFHDDSLDRVCGTEGILEEKDWAEISSLKLFNSAEGIPHLSEVLDLTAGSVPLMIEIKTTRRIRLSVSAVKEALKNYSGPVSIVSFDPLVLREVKRQLPEVLRGQLMEYSLNKKSLPLVKRIILHYALMNGINRPDFLSVRYDQVNLTWEINRLFGGYSAVWPIGSEAVEEALKNRFENIIFEHYRPKP